MSRSPIYNLDKTGRICSFANDTWTYQKFTGSPDARPSNTVDPWMNCYTPVEDKTRAAAMLMASNKVIEEERARARA